MKTAFAVAPWIVLSSALATAQPKSPEVELATHQVESGEFEDALQTLQHGLGQPDVTDDILVELYRLLGLTSLYLGREDLAEDAFTKLLQARPDFELPASEPPKVLKLYARIKDDIQGRRVRPVSLGVQLPSSAPSAKPLYVEAEVKNLPLGAKVDFYYRRSGAQSFNSIRFLRDWHSRGIYYVFIPAYDLPTESQRYEVECYIEVSDRNFTRLAGRGDVYTPLSFAVLPSKQTRPDSSLEKSSPAWTWVTASTIAAGTIAGFVLIGSGSRLGGNP